MAGNTPENKASGSWSGQVETAWRKYSQELWALFYAQCGNADRAGDAVQEAFVRLQAQEQAGIRDLRAWLLRVGRNWLRDMARRRKVAAGSVETLDYLPEDGDSPIARLQIEELHEQVRCGLDRLREEDRQVLVLRYALSWSSIRIAEALESTPAAVDMRLSRARKRLAVILRELGISLDEQDD